MSFVAEVYLENFKQLLIKTIRFAIEDEGKLSKTNARPNRTHQKQPLWTLWSSLPGGITLCMLFGNLKTF